jgi:hydrogenase maturation protein HypF
MRSWSSPPGFRGILEPVRASIREVSRKSPRPKDRARLQVAIRGSVQGVGFRPFVYRLADGLGLSGWVANDNRGVTLEVEGEREALEEFSRRLTAERPAASEIREIDHAWAEPAGFVRFEILASDGGGEKLVEILPDLATCSLCREDVFDPHDRRHRYPFTNCTHCGPRFSIVTGLPYDRPNTTMAGFTMCPICRGEYQSPLDRRFHAQPNACPSCGPRLALWGPTGEHIADGDRALVAAAEALAAGRVVAVKGLGGFHLMVDARDGKAVSRLRSRKGRREKPLAVMAADAEWASMLCVVSEAEAAALASPEAPIVLMRRRPDAGIAEGVAPRNPYLGVMLPYTPLHHLLLRETGFPVVATSGNLSEEPICTDEREAVARLSGIADLFLVHDRPIARHVDDSVAVVSSGRVRLVRRARGFAPRALILPEGGPSILAVGAHLKNAVALSVGRRVFVSQHIGDMESAPSQEAFARVIADFLAMYDARPAAIAHDLHPDYATTLWARRAVAGEFSAEPLARLAGLPLAPVQHHHAHLASCLTDAGVAGPALGVIWDGTGYGTDATVWGGEFLLGDASGFERVGHLLPFRLPGGEAAVREPRRSALGLLYAAYGEAALGWEDLEPVRAFDAAERRVLSAMFARGANSPVTTSAGRLFDAISALAGLGLTSAFEGQAAMALEFAADEGLGDAYPMPLADGAPLVLDWRPLLEAVLADVRADAGTAAIASRFHAALVAGIVRVARAAGEPRVVLSGGCFQNRLLATGATNALSGAGFEVLLHRQVPPNDGGIALGQIAVATAVFRRSPAVL